jgi:hybrid polyketide synthase/nonribosomal peptide synthetase ACE1
LSRERFIPDRYGSSEFQAQGWYTLFRTGDRARLQADGSFIFEGRVDGDTLIKLRGLRIDLGDIESTTLTTANGELSEVAVSLRGEPQFLVGHVVLSPMFAASDLDVDSFLEELLLKLPLPMYMKPAMLIPVDSLPMTIHGKRDRKALVTLPLGMDDEDNRLEDVEDLDSVTTDDLTETEERLKNIWLAILPAEAVSARHRQVPNGQGKKKTSDGIHSHTDFFAAGGNSLLLAQLQAEIKKEFGVMLPIKLLMEVCSEGLGELADMVEAAEE